jgi:hypothetical protein
VAGEWRRSGIVALQAKWGRVIVRPPSPPALLRETAAYYDREGHALFARSEDLMTMATEYFSKARALRSEADDREAVDEAREHWGKNVKLVKGRAA